MWWYELKRIIIYRILDGNRSAQKLLQRELRIFWSLLLRLLFRFWLVCRLFLALFLRFFQFFRFYRANFAFFFSFWAQFDSNFFFRGQTRLGKLLNFVFFEKFTRKCTFWTGKSSEGPSQASKSSTEKPIGSVSGTVEVTRTWKKYIFIKNTVKFRFLFKKIYF